jgi:DNA-binding NtrC family response regulator
VNVRSVLYWTSDHTFKLAANLEAAGWRVHATTDPQHAATSALENRFRVGVAAFDPGATSLSAVQDLVLSTRAMEWIALVPPQSLIENSAKQLIVDTFFDYHTMPPDYARLMLCLGHAYGFAELRHAVDPTLATTDGKFSMTGRSPQMQLLYWAIRRISGTDASVLVTGETGTGKELVARAIHLESSRRQRPYVVVNCAAFPEGLIQTELFGHERGAFTDARERKIGRIEAAAGGTVFLDEVGDLPPSVQVMLLRFLQERTIERLGGKESIHVDVRVIAATHVDLEELVKRGRFREDLYYRLNVLRLHVPALRERDGDVELMARRLFLEHARESRKRIRGFSRAALDRLNAHDWPGNVRELINRMQRAIVMCEGRLITPKDLGLERRSESRGVHSLDALREQAEQRAIHDALIRNRTVSRASAELGISRMTLYRRLVKYGLKLKPDPG